MSRYLILRLEQVITAVCQFESENIRSLVVVGSCECACTFKVNLGAVMTFRVGASVFQVLVEEQRVRGQHDVDLLPRSTTNIKSTRPTDIHGNEMLLVIEFVWM